jgi:hypothetical protein
VISADLLQVWVFEFTFAIASCWYGRVYGALIADAKAAAISAKAGLLPPSSSSSSSSLDSLDSAASTLPAEASLLPERDPEVADPDSVLPQRPEHTALVNQLLQVRVNSRMYRILGALSIYFGGLMSPLSSARWNSDEYLFDVYILCAFLCFPQMLMR